MISVFTPSHDPRYLNDCFLSLRSQTYEDWEWIVLLNHGARWVAPIFDPRVNIIIDDDITGVGAAKWRACMEAHGDIFVELDHDDMLMTEDALEIIYDAFIMYPDAGLIYSHCAQMSEDGRRDDSVFDFSHGWQYQQQDGFQYAISLAPTPHNVAYIWYAPNHVRAFSRDAYFHAGGYDQGRYILDDQDLMCRLYQVGDFHLIDECLYLQRMHPGNTQRQQETNNVIQQETVVLYDKYIEANALAWTGRNHLLPIDLGAAHARPPGYLGLDEICSSNVNLVVDVSRGLPLKNNSVGVIRAVDFLEHISDKVALFNELYRVLAPGGMLLSQTPSTDGRGAFQDPTHVAYYNENSFWYFTNGAYQKYVPSITARYQVSRLVTYYPSEWHRENAIQYVTSNLIALKEGMSRNGGRILW